MKNVHIVEKKDCFKVRFSELSFLCLILAFFVAEVFGCIRFGFFRLFPNGTMHENVEASSNVLMETMGVVLCGFLYFSVFIDERRSKFRSLFLQLIFFEAMALFFDSWTWFVGGKVEFNALVKILNLLFDLCCVIRTVIFWGTEIEVMNLRGNINRFMIPFIRISTVLFLAITIANVKLEFFYSISGGMYYRAGTYWLQYIYSLFVYLILLFYAIKIKINWKLKSPFIVASLLPIAVMGLQTFAYTLAFTTPSVLITILVLYINIHVELGRKIEEFKSKVMISQIQPHFMYNTLTTIKALCKYNPELAASTITNFADYLRGNMDFSDLSETIPFERELKHTRIYTEIEKLRFDNITFDFDIHDLDFYIPSLTVQPMVENAVRHGVRSKKDARILVRTFADEKYHNVIIKDNGKGFEEHQFNGSRTHIGLLNTKLRVERLCNGKFEVQSVKGEGVTIIIKLPK
ncbi:MAG: histidine kinase [Treponema sp.]|nr:histidine kinase [Treponema sp.]